MSWLFKQTAKTAEKDLRKAEAALQRVANSRNPNTAELRRLHTLVKKRRRDLKIAKLNAVKPPKVTSFGSGQTPITPQTSQTERQAKYKATVDYQRARRQNRLRHGRWTIAEAAANKIAYDRMKDITRR